MKAPSFFIAAETGDGMTMEYRSKRRGFQYYVQGQIKEISKNFALEIKKLEIELKKQEVGILRAIINENTAWPTNRTCCGHYGLFDTQTEQTFILS